MADRGDTHYSIPALNKWFLVSSVIILISTVWMVIDDWQRPWKAYQREFRELELARVRAEEQQLSAEGAMQREQELMAQVASAQRSVDQRAGYLAQKSETLRLAKGELWSAIEAAKKAKSGYNWERYQFEEHRIAARDSKEQEALPAMAEKLAAFEKAMNDTAGRQEELETKKAAAEADVNTLTKDLEVARKELSGGTRALDQVRKRLSQLDPAAMTGAELAADIVRDAPGLDFVKPNLKVNKVVLDNLTFELNFTKKKRIDMCHTCHLGADRAGFEAEDQPFASHPRLDLYLSSKSPHPLKDVGCTICHRGAGEALDFVRADHRPANAQQQAEWEHEHHWHKQHQWDYPMLSAGNTEAS